jgi:hypothetical protein
MGPGNAGQRDCGAKAAPDSTFHIDALSMGRRRFGTVRNAARRLWEGTPRPDMRRVQN